MEKKSILMPDLLNAFQLKFCGLYVGYNKQLVSV